MNGSPAPSRQELREVMTALVRGERSREDASQWAGTWVLLDHPDVEDLVVRNGLKALLGADLRVSPTEYLHSDIDFQNWLSAFEEAAGLHG